MKKGYISHIHNETVTNNNFRKVLYTSKHIQLVVMSLQPNEDIGTEIHQNIDQFIRIESGEGKAVINGTETMLKDTDAIVIPAGVEHNIINTGNSVMKLYTLYAAPEHKDGIIHITKEMAEIHHEKEQFDGITTEY